MILRRSALAARSVLLATFSALFVSGATLNYVGLNYSSDSTSGGLKLHPYTMLTLFALATLMSGSRALRSCVNSAGFRAAIFGLLFSVAVVLGKSITGDGQSLGFAIDTLVVAFLIAGALNRLPASYAFPLATMTKCFIIIECTIAMLEVISGSNFVPIETWYGQWFRATGLHGHPLNNALILLTVAMCAQIGARHVTSIWIFVLTVGALIAFGARGALIVYVFANAFIFVRFGLTSTKRIPILIVGGTIALLSMAFALSSGIAGDRITQVGVYDDSSQVRVRSLDMMSTLDWQHVLLGVSPGEVQKLMDDAHIGVIENFLIGYILSFGAILTLIMFYWLFVVAKKLISDVPAGEKWRFVIVAVAFSCAALTNNSLMTKTPAIYLLFIGLWCAKCRLKYVRHRAQRGAFDFEHVVTRYGHKDPYDGIKNA